MKERNVKFHSRTLVETGCQSGARGRGGEQQCQHAAQAKAETTHHTRDTLETQRRQRAESRHSQILSLSHRVSRSPYMHTARHIHVHACTHARDARRLSTSKQTRDPFLNYDCWPTLATQSCIMRRHSSSCCPQSHSSLDPSKSPVRAVWRQQDGGEVCKCKLLRLRLAAPLIEGAL